jgi:Tfp pilus assembly protein PilN
MTKAAALEKALAAVSDVRARAGRLWHPLLNALTAGLMEGIILPQLCVSVSIEKGCLWVALGTRYLSKIKIAGSRKYTFDDGKYPSPGSLASTLSIAVKELKARNAGITLAIPREWAILRTIEFPATVKENLTDVVSYEMDRLTPFAADDAYYDFTVVGEHDGRVSLTVVAARADLIDQYVNALKEQGLRMERMGLSLSNIGTSCSFVGETQDFIFLEMDQAGYEAGFVHNNQLVSGLGDVFAMTDERSMVSAVVEGLNPLIDTALERGVSPVILSHAKDLVGPALEGRFRAPVKRVSDQDLKSRLVGDRENVSFIAAGGLLESLWSRAKGFNLLEKGLRRRVKVPFGMTVILICLILASLVPYFLLPLEREGNRLAEIERQISLRRGEVKRVERLRKEVEGLRNEITTIREFKENTPMDLVIVKELTAVLPKTAWLTRTRVADAAVDIEGYASSASEILPKLEQSPHFKKVEFASPTIRDVRMNADRFVIKMEIEGVGEGEGERQRDGKKK